MVVVKISGGLGNQLFQYAYGRQIADRSGAELKLDLRKVGRKYHPWQRRPWHYALWPFRIRASVASLAECRSLKFDTSSAYGKLYAILLQQFHKTKDARGASPHYVKQRRVGFVPELMDVTDPAYLDGHWESGRYFPDVEASLREEFQLRDGPQGRNAELLDEIRGSNAVSIHVRRTDFLFADGGTKNICTLDYFQQAAEIIRKKAGAAHFFVFSDDIPWCRDNLDLGGPMSFSDANGRTTAHEDLRLMSHCKHHVVPNSTLGWWGAWLNPDPAKLVVCPKAWPLADVIPDEWIAI
jgi:hypothetical protein